MIVGQSRGRHLLQGVAGREGRVEGEIYEIRMS